MVLPFFSFPLLPPVLYMTLSASRPKTLCSVPITCFHLLYDFLSPIFLLPFSTPPIPLTPTLYDTRKNVVMFFAQKNSV